MNIYKRLARAEAMADAQKAELIEVMQGAYNAACEANDEEQAAELCRRLRNKLLDLSDKEMSLDRLNLNTSSAVGFIASLGQVFSGAWAVYRQQLRDLPEQPGFPFNVNFPEAPEE